MKISLVPLILFLYIHIVLNLDFDEPRFNHMVTGQVLMAPSNRYYAKLTDTGNLGIFMAQVPYNNDEINFNDDDTRHDVPVWVSRNVKAGRGPYSLIILPSGILNVKDKNDRILWSDGPINKGVGPFRAEVHDDGVLVVFDSQNNSIWTSGR